MNYTDFVIKNGTPLIIDGCFVFDDIELYAKLLNLDLDKSIITEEINMVASSLCASFSEQYPDIDYEDYTPLIKKCHAICDKHYERKNHETD